MDDLTSIPRPPKKIIFVLCSLDVGGIENWLVELVTEFRRRYGAQLQCDFLTILKSGGRFEPTLNALGCRLFHIPLRYVSLPRFLMQTRALLARERHDVIHAQTDHLSGLVLLAAHWAGVPRRLFHIHSTQSPFTSSAPLRRRLAGPVLRWLSMQQAHIALACSADARNCFFNGHWPVNAHILHCGINFAPFRADVVAARTAVRKELGLPVDARLLLAVGRLAPEKNFSLLAKIMVELRQSSSCWLIHAGEGEERDELQRLIETNGVGDRFRLLGLRRDVPLLMLAADVFVMPSWYEGLGLVLIEAQAAGLPVVASNRITREVEVLPSLFHWERPEAPPKLWADTITKVLSTPRPVTPSEACEKMEPTSFSIVQCARECLNYYNLLDVPELAVTNKTPNSITP